MTQADLDLQGLALERPEAPAGGGRRRPYISRYLLPMAVIVGFVVLLVTAAGEQFLPRKQVTVVPVIVTRAEIQQEGTPLFQAAGWVEPRPTPASVPALTDGVVQQLLVTEGTDLQVGEPVARLVDVDAQLALRTAQAELALRQAEVQRAQADLKAARQRVERPIHLHVELADAESKLARVETELGKLPFSIQSAQARADFARQNLQRKRSIEGAIAGQVVQQAQSDFDSAQAQLQELEQSAPRLQREAAALRKKVNALETQLELLIEESRQLETAQAQLAAAIARRDEAEIAVEKAQLAVDRTLVRAPSAGRVLELVAYPGTRVTGKDTGAASSTVVTLYDPAMLQVRADVRLEDVALVQPGQRVRIETASVKEPFTGTVLLPTSSANVQKNTLEVKIAIDDPPATIRPEMLVTATFLAPPQAGVQQDENQQVERLLVPRQLVQDEQGGHYVWIADAQGTAQRRPIQVGKANSETLVEVTGGLSATDKVIASGHEDLSVGQRIEIVGEHSSIGLEQGGI